MSDKPREYAVILKDGEQIDIGARMFHLGESGRLTVYEETSAELLAGDPATPIKPPNVLAIYAPGAWQAIEQVGDWPA